MIVGKRPFFLVLESCLEKSLSDVLEGLEWFSDFSLSGLHKELFEWRNPGKISLSKATFVAICF